MQNDWHQGLVSDAMIQIEGKDWYPDPTGSGSWQHVESRMSIQAWEALAKIKCRSSDKILGTGIKIEGHGIHANDALHIACAIESQCKYFITTDKGLTSKKLGEIQIINPIDFVRKMEESDEN